MNNLQYMKQNGSNALTWALGGNNIAAIRDVLKGEYKHHGLSPIQNPTTALKLKQIGTELTHFVLKYGTYGYMLDQALIAKGWQPIAVELGSSVLSSVANKLCSCAYYAFPTCYAGNHFLKNLAEGLKQIRDNRDSVSKIGQGLLKFADAGLAVPVVLCAYNNGAFGGMVAAGSLFVVNKIADMNLSSMRGKWGEAAVKAVFVSAVYYATYGSLFYANVTNSTDV